jgi:hypothetical protein
MKPPHHRTPPWQQRQRASQFVGFLSGLIGPEKLGLDPTFQVIALYLHPVPLTLRNFEAFAFGDYPKNTSIRRGCRPDIYARTLHKRDILVLARGDGLTRQTASSRPRGRGNLGRSLDRGGSRRVGPSRHGKGCRIRRWSPRIRPDRSHG